MQIKKVVFFISKLNAVILVFSTTLKCSNRVATKYIRQPVYFKVKVAFMQL